MSYNAGPITGLSQYAFGGGSYSVGNTPGIYQPGNLAQNFGGAGVVTSPAGGIITGENGSPSTGQNISSLLSALEGQAVSAAQAETPSTITIGSTSYSVTTLLIIGAAVLIFAMVVRR